MFTREIYDLARAEIDTRREEAERISLAREEELRSLSPEIKEIDAELSKTGLLIFKTAVSGSDISPIRERNESLVSKRRAAILALGLPEDYDKPKYTCNVCQDSGRCDNGAMCSCLKELIRLETVKASGMGQLIEKQSFENFDLTHYAALGENEARQMAGVLNFCKRFASGFSESVGKTLLFIGKTGTGKTHISSAIAKQVIERGFSVTYDSSMNIFNAFEEDHFGKDRYRFSREAHEPKSDKYMNADLLIIDDLGTEFITQFTVSCLYNLINTRQNKGLSTIISTNFSPDEISRKYEDRLYSRLMGSDTTVLMFVGKDHRLL